MNESKVTIIGLTTDPYLNIYGYALVFFRFFDYLERSTHHDIILIANNGVSSTLVKNKNFKILRINKHANALVKTIVLIYLFVFSCLPYGKDSIIIANGEIPELVAAWILKIKFAKVYCIIQDTRIRDNSWFAYIAHMATVFLIYRIKNVVFTNKHTMSQYSETLNKKYIGNPIFIKR